MRGIEKGEKIMFEEFAMLIIRLTLERKRREKEEKTKLKSIKEVKR